MKKLTLSIDKYEVAEINNSQFSKLKLYICHDLDNKNGSYISLDSMKQAEDTLLNKPIIMRMNKSYNDFEEHEADTVVVGVIPQIGHNIHYEQIGSRTYLVAEAIIWKYYSSCTLEIFERDKNKGISMEIEVFSDHKREEDGFIQIDSYAYLAVCLLGNKYETGMYNTTAQVVGFSKENTLENLKKEWSMFVECSNNDKTSSSVRLRNRLNKNCVKEDENCELEFSDTQNLTKEVHTMAVDTNKENEELEDKKEEMSSETDVKLEEMAKTEDANEEEKEFAEEVKPEDSEKEETKEEEAEEEAEVEEAEVEEKEEMACNKEMSENYEAKYAEVLTQMAGKDEAILDMNAKITTLNNEKEALVKEVETLKIFKLEIEKAEKIEKVQNTFSTLTSILSKEEIDEWKEKSEKYDDITLFERDLKAFACDKILKTKPTSTSQFSRMAVNLDNAENNEIADENVWSRIGKRVSK